MCDRDYPNLYDVMLFTTETYVMKLLNSQEDFGGEMMG